MLLKEENKEVGRKNQVFADPPINFTVKTFKVLISFWLGRIVCMMSCV